MGHLDAQFGRLFNDGVEIELRGGFDFVGFDFEPFDDPVTGAPRGWRIIASSQGIVGSGTYLGQVVVWNGSAWVPTPDDGAAIRRIYPVSGDASEQTAFVGGTGSAFAGLTKQDENGDGLDKARAVLRGEESDSAVGGSRGEAQMNAVAAGGVEHLGIRVSYNSDAEDGPVGLYIGFFGARGAKKQNVLTTTGTADDKVNRLIAVLRDQYGLITTS